MGRGRAINLEIDIIIITVIIINVIIIIIMIIIIIIIIIVPCCCYRKTGNYNFHQYEKRQKIVFRHVTIALKFVFRVSSRLLFVWV